MVQKLPQMVAKYIKKKWLMKEVRSRHKRPEWTGYDLETPAVKDAQSVWDQTRRNYWTLAAVRPTGICFMTNEPICAAFLRCRVASAVGPEEKYLLHACNTDVAVDITEGSKNRCRSSSHVVCAELCKKKKEAALEAKRPQGALCFLFTKKKQTNKQTETYSEVMSVETEEKQTKAEAAIALFGNCCR